MYLHMDYRLLEIVTAAYGGGGGGASKNFTKDIGKRH